MVQQYEIVSYKLLTVNNSLFEKLSEKYITLQFMQMSG